MKNMTGTLWVILLFAAVAIVTAICWLVYGPQDGARTITLWFGSIAVLIAVLSRLLGGKWFTDSSGGR